MEFLGFINEILHSALVFPSFLPFSSPSHAPPPRDPPPFFLSFLKIHTIYSNAGKGVSLIGFDCRFRAPWFVCGGWPEDWGGGFGLGGEGLEERGFRDCGCSCWWW